MKNSTQEFLAYLTALPANCFEHRFAQRLAHLNLAGVLDRNDLTLLCEAALRAHLCQIAIDSAGSGKTRTDKESERLRAEWDFMNARDIFYASPGWQTLDVATQGKLVNEFLTVAVKEHCFAW